MENLKRKKVKNREIEMEDALYDPKIEKYLEDNIKFVEEYDRSSEATFFNKLT